MGLVKNLYRRMRTAFLSPIDARLIAMQQSMEQTMQAQQIQQQKQQALLESFQQSFEALAQQSALHARTIENQHGAADAVIKQQLQELRTRLDAFEQNFAQHLPHLAAFRTDADAAIALSLRELSRIQDQLHALQQRMSSAASEPPAAT
jgi:hypothetical protein